MTDEMSVMSVASTGASGGPFTLAWLDPSQNPPLVTGVSTVDQLPDPGSLAYVDVTDLAAQPELGWTYDPAADEFTEPVPVQNRSALLSKAQTALAHNRDYLALSPPTNAQVVAQMAAVTRQIDALIRIVGDYLDSTGGT